MVLRKTTPPDPDEGKLVSLVAQHMPDADPGLVKVVASVAGLLACVAYADREYSEREESRVREELNRIHGLDSKGADAICDVLAAHIREISSTVSHACTRTLRENASENQRLEVLQVLVDLAAVNDELTTAETNLLRRITDSLGLSQNDYNKAQALHRDKLAVLK